MIDIISAFIEENPMYQSTAEIVYPSMMAYKQTSKTDNVKGSGGKDGKNEASMVKCSCGHKETEVWPHPSKLSVSEHRKSFAFLWVRDPEMIAFHNQVNTDCLMPQVKELLLKHGECTIANAMYDYEACAEDELTYEIDDYITNITKCDVCPWIGVCRGKKGLFAPDYVKFLHESSTNPLPCSKVPPSFT